MPYAMIFYYNNFLAYCLLNLRKLKIGGHFELPPFPLGGTP